MEHGKIAAISNEQWRGCHLLWGNSLILPLTEKKKGNFLHQHHARVDLLLSRTHQ
jgi:hypothetical protein